MTTIKPKVWHVIYTRSRAEKKVLADLTAQGITCFMPMQKKLRQWKDRKKLVETSMVNIGIQADDYLARYICYLKK